METDGNQGQRLLADNCLYSVAEIAYLARSEQVVHLSDLVLRRTSLAITGQISSRIIDKVAEIVADELGWKPAWKNKEIESLTTELEDYYGVCSQTLKNRSI